MAALKFVFVLFLSLVDVMAYVWRENMDPWITGMSNSLLESIQRVLPVRNVSLNQKRDIATGIIMVNESRNMNSSDIDLLNAFSHVSSLLHQFRSTGEAVSHANDTMKSLWAWSAKYMSDLMVTELRSLWMIFQGNRDLSRDSMVRFLNKAALFTSMDVAWSSKFANEVPGSVVLNHSASSSEIRSLPLSVFRRGSKLLHIGAGSNDFVRWMNATGWFDRIDEWDPNRHDVSEYDVVVLCYERTSEDVFKGKKVDIISARYLGEEFKVDEKKSNIVQKYLNDKSVWYYFSH